MTAFFTTALELLLHRKSISFGWKIMLISYSPFYGIFAVFMPMLAVPFKAFRLLDHMEAKLLSHRTMERAYRRARARAKFSETLRGENEHV